jgi:predicted lipid-binding transport protein (Tim44 family)
MTVADAASSSKVEVTLEAPEDEPGAELEPVVEDTPEKAPETAAKPEKAKKEARKPRKGKPKDEEAPDEGDGPSIAAHPRAARSVARAKSWGALVGFVLGGYLSLPTHTVASAGLRALVAGLICWVAVWAGAVFFWRRMVMLEIRAREDELVRAVEAARSRNQAAAAQGAQAAARAQAAAQFAGEAPGARR